MFTIGDTFDIVFPSRDTGMFTPFQVKVEEIGKSGVTKGLVKCTLVNSGKVRWFDPSLLKQSKDKASAMAK